MDIQSSHKHLHLHSYSTPFPLGTVPSIALLRISLETFVAFSVLSQSHACRSSTILPMHTCSTSCVASLSFLSGFVSHTLLQSLSKLLSEFPSSLSSFCWCVIPFFAFSVFFILYTPRTNILYT
jgi:hypothetical protein